ncbi:MAG: exodeoxyribonuclease V subunit gamma [Marinobacter sp.]|nr:exodeoxyribonuclease V subunit gamma [Marinobacter sp.]
MIHVFPSNKLEPLADALATLLSVPVANALEPDVIMVQHQGMQHWLSMRLASHPARGIAMNLEFPLPVKCMWQLIRVILDDGEVPQVSPYQREILVWRLYQLLASDQVVNDPGCAEPTRYWQRQSPRQQALRRYQLAQELADLYEQYLMFRPDWIQAWDQGRLADSEAAEAATLHWQARLWRLLVAEHPHHPVALLQRAMTRLQQPVEGLPERLFMFGINTLAPLWLGFLKALSEQQGTDVHVLYLNPSNEYWQDASSEKQAVRQRARWLMAHDDDADFIVDTGNPLVTSLGQQGQQFVRLLCERADYESSGFEAPASGHLLAALQADMLYFRDGREFPSDVADDSITITRAHSALREVQGLHDWLLHRFNDDPTLTPKDVVVLCPNVEHYAPFVEAVFAGRFEELADTVPPLPCTIADRNPGDADPAVAVFLDLLTLPDARFQVSQILAWLQVPAIQQRFQLTPADLDRISHWLEAAAVHWGLDGSHKQQWVPEQGNGFYTWRQGLERLLLGFAWGDTEAVVGNQLLLPQVEGADALLLGRLIGFIRTLEGLLKDMQVARDLTDWQRFLHERLRLALLAQAGVDDAIHEDLITVIKELGDHGRAAGFDGEVPLAVIRQVVKASLSSPARTGRQFLAGQVTVCSMVPMRSVPFRVVALLGLNDGEFPRQRPPLGFDRMALDQPRPGDRSRRGDDRYLFLEALLSARDYLYLSYQGHDARTNSEKQPSLVLTELMDYLAAATGWRQDDIRSLPLQPFSAGNYRGQTPGFDQHWLRFTRPLPPQQRLITLASTGELPDTLVMHRWVRALEHPARHFAEARLGLFLERRQQAELSDTEPFTTSHLDRYQLQQQMIDSLWLDDTASVEFALNRARLSGRLPAHALVEDELQTWQQQASVFVGHLSQRAGRPQSAVFSLSVSGITLSSSVVLGRDEKLVTARLANPKARDRLSLWLNHLLANTQGDYGSTGFYRGKGDKVLELSCEPLPAHEAQAQLAAWLAFWQRSLCEPLPLHAQFGIKVTDDAFAGKIFELEWQGDYQRPGLGSDPYLQWFWPEPPDPAWIAEQLRPLYEPMLASMTEVQAETEAGHG